MFKINVQWNELINVLKEMNEFFGKQKQIPYVFPEWDQQIEPMHHLLAAYRLGALGNCLATLYGETYGEHGYNVIL